MPINMFAPAASSAIAQQLAAKPQPMQVGQGYDPARQKMYQEMMSEALAGRPVGSTLEGVGRLAQLAVGHYGADKQSAAEAERRKAMDEILRNPSSTSSDMLTGMTQYGSDADRERAFAAITEAKMLAEKSAKAEDERSSAAAKRAADWAKLTTPEEKYAYLISSGDDQLENNAGDFAPKPMPTKDALDLARNESFKQAWSEAQKLPEPDRSAAIQNAIMMYGTEADRGKLLSGMYGKTGTMSAADAGVTMPPEKYFAERAQSFARTVGEGPLAQGATDVAADLLSGKYPMPPPALEERSKSAESMVWGEHAKLIGSLRSGSASAKTIAPQILDAMEDVRRGRVPTGLINQTLVPIKRYLGSVGLWSQDELAAIDTMTALQNFLTIQARGKPNDPESAYMAGALSDRDVAFLKEMVPGLNKSAAANQYLLAGMFRLMSRRVAIAALADQYTKGADGRTRPLDAGFQEWVGIYDNTHPLWTDDERTAMRAAGLPVSGGSSPTTAAAPAAAVGSSPLTAEFASPEAGPTVPLTDATGAPALSAADGEEIKSFRMPSGKTVTAIKKNGKWYKRELSEKELLLELGWGLSK